MADDRTERPERGAENVQGDLFTGEWQAKPPKRGNGSHVRLKEQEGEKAVVPRMASYAGQGPAGSYCRDCVCFGEVAVQTGVDDVEINRTGCAIYAQHMGHAAATFGFARPASTSWPRTSRSGTSSSTGQV